MNVKEALQKARALIADPKDWHQGSAFKYDPVTCKISICLLTALDLACGDEFTPAYNAVLKQIEPQYVADFNDTHLHSEVLAALDHTIASLPN